MQSGFSDQNGMNLEINDRRKFVKLTNMCKFIVYSNSGSKRRNHKGNLKKLNMNKNKNTKYQNLRDSNEAGLREIYSHEQL